MDDSGEFQDVESNYSFTRYQSTAVVPSPRSMLSRDRSLPFDTWILFETQGYVFLAIHAPCSVHH